MTSLGKPLQVGWKVNSLASNMASLRYRAVLPIVALEGSEVRNRLFRSGLEANLDGLDVLVIVKSFTAEDLLLAELASARGIRLVLDLCDNIFIGSYAATSNTVSPAQAFLTMSEHASCIVATTEPLAEVIRAHVPQVPVHVVPDGIETPAVAREILQVLRHALSVEKAQRMQLLRQRARNVAQRVRVEGVQLIPSLVAYAARRGGRALARGIHQRVRRGAHPQHPAPAAPAGPERSGTAKILWFGNHGAEHARFGMLDILEFRRALEAVARDLEVELVVVSNDRAKYEKNIAPLAIPSRYVEWSQKAVDSWLGQAAVVIIPNTLDPFSICKSANRTVLALAHGVPVVATPTPALAALAPYIRTGDAETELREILAHPEDARSRARDGYREAASLYGMPAVRSQWLGLLKDLPAPPQRASTPPPWMAVVLHLVQDLDLALPIVRAAREAGVSCQAWCSAALVGKSPRVFATLRQEAIPFRILPDERALREFRFAEGTRVLLTVAETNLGPHRLPRTLTELAKQQGLFVATLQHGFENVGLTHDDPLQALDKVDIAAHRIYTWGPLQTLHPRIRPGVRERCVPVGCPKDVKVPAAELPGLLPAGARIVGVFENLHWHRYSDDYRRAFLANVTALSRAFPDVVFLVKPHHAGVWLTQRYDGEQPAGDNLVVADPQQPPWERYTASALLPHLAAVITTPSTVALDAARIGLPVAVVDGGLGLENYRPLTLLQGPDDWPAFVAQALGDGTRAPLARQSTAFVDSVLVPGDAARRIIDDLRAAAGA